MRVQRLSHEKRCAMTFRILELHTHARPTRCTWMLYLDVYVFLTSGSVTDVLVHHKLKLAAFLAGLTVFRPSWATLYASHCAFII